MEIYSQETTNGKPSSKFVIQIDKREAQTLIEIVSAAAEANKRRRLFKLWREKIEERLPCF